MTATRNALDEMVFANCDTLAEMVEAAYAEYVRSCEAAVKMVLEMGLAPDERTAKASYLKAMRETATAERVRLNGLRDCDRADTERAAWAFAGKRLRERLEAELEA
jgi:hypothetical protein